MLSVKVKKVSTKWPSQQSWSRVEPSLCHPSSHAKPIVPARFQGWPVVFSLFMFMSFEVNHLAGHLEWIKNQQWQITQKSARISPRSGSSLKARIQANVHTKGTVNCSLKGGEIPLSKRQQREREREREKKEKKKKEEEKIRRRREDAVDKRGEKIILFSYWALIQRLNYVLVVLVARVQVHSKT